MYINRIVMTIQALVHTTIHLYQVYAYDDHSHSLQKH